MKVFTTNKQNVRFVIVEEVKNVTMQTKINYQINEKYIMKQNWDKLLQKQNDRYINFKEVQRS